MTVRTRTWSALWLAAMAVSCHRPAEVEKPKTGEAAEEEEEEDATTKAKPHGHGHGHHKEAACAASLDTCPIRGCEPENTGHAEFNAVKRRTTAADGSAVTFASAVPVTFDMLLKLQDLAGQAVGTGGQLQPGERPKLASFDVGGVTLGEGTPVRLVAYLAPHDPKHAASGTHPGGVESVNCRLTAATDKDIHIPVIPQPGATECDGVVVEMIPQGRAAAHPAWTENTLHAIGKTVPVMIVGPLFYDNEHEVNPDCSHLVTGQPKRSSLWEVHPVSELYRCDSGSCSADSLTGWTKVD